MKRFWGVVLVMLSAAAFGTMPIFARFAYASGTDPLSVLFLRFLMAGTLIMLYLWVRRIPMPRGKTLLGLIGMGALGYVAQSISYFNALVYASASLVALLLYVYPVLVTVLAMVIFKERVTKVKLLALALALTGAVMTVGSELEGSWKGVLLALAAAVAYSLYIVAGSRLTKGVHPMASTGVVIISTEVVYIGVTLFRGFTPPQTSLGWVMILCLAVICTIAAIGTFLAGMELVGPTTSAILSTGEPAVTIALAVLVLGEQITVLRVAGGVLILAAVIILTRSEAKAR